MSPVNQDASLVNDIISTRANTPLSISTSSTGLNMPVAGSLRETSPLSYPKGDNKVQPNSAIAPMTTLTGGGMIDLDEKTIHTNLDDRLWGANEHLIPVVRDKLLDIANYFRDLVDFYVVEDIVITGSEANYNYEETSDIDLHLVYDFNKMLIDPQLLKTYFNAKKKIFNDQYDISIKGIPVEIGVEDINTPLVASGTYSLLKDEWVVKPSNSAKEIPDIYNDELEVYSNKIEQAIESHDRDIIEQTFKDIVHLRKDSLKNASGGEFAKGNLIYKRLRALGYVKRLADALNAAVSQSLSLESMQRDYIIPSEPDIRSFI